MTTYLPPDPRSVLLEKRRRYEAEAIAALLDEDDQEREERAHLVRASQGMIAATLHLPIYDPKTHRA